MFIKHLSVKKFYQDKRVLVTGAGGFIGSHLVRALVREGADVFAVVGRQKNAQRLSEIKKNVTILFGDLTDVTVAKKILKASRPAIVFNLASPMSNKSSAELDAAQNIFDITRALLLASAEQKVSRFIQMGSMEEYGAAKAPFKESALEQPVSPYGEVKVSTTHWALGFGTAQEIETVVIRPSAVFGEGQDFGRMLVPNFIKAGLEGMDFDMHEGKNLRDFIYVEDLIEGMLLAGASEKCAGEIINFGAGTPIEVRKVAEMVNEAMGDPIRINFGAQPIRNNESPVAYLDCSKAKKLLGWHARTPLRDALQKTVAWYRDAHR